jgi:hypothetical protein
VLVDAVEKCLGATTLDDGIRRDEILPTPRDGRPQQAGAEEAGDRAREADSHRNVSWA